MIVYDSVRDRRQNSRLGLLGFGSGNQFIVLRCVRCFTIIIFLQLGILYSNQGLAATLNVTNFGAIGDAVRTLATTAKDSTTVSLQPTNRLGPADVGKLIELFGVGPVSSGTNNQDLIAYIVSVANGTNVAISAPASRTLTDVNCTFGTQNAEAFQKCVAACQGTNTIVNIPAGCYLLVPPQILDPHFAMASAATLCLAVSISKGGIQLEGDSPDNTVLLGNGAWILNNGFVERGILFGCVGPITNDAPLLFVNLAFDGGVQLGNQQLGSGPANPIDGSGWDVTHDAVIDMGQPPFHADKRFFNCHFAHWRGEMVKSVVAWDSGFIGVTNCSFWDGDGSGFNFNWTPHVISGCLFSNLDMAMEYYVGSMRTNSIFENNTITNTRIGITLVGALTNYPSPGYSIVGNTISASKYDIEIGPARNVTIAGNTFFGGLAGVATDDYAYQGTDFNSDILVDGNQFNNTVYPLAVCASGRNRLVNMTWSANTAWGCSRFASGYGWSSNVLFTGNSSLQPAANNSGDLDSSALTGQWFIDDGSNRFPVGAVNISLGRLTNIVSYVDGVSHEIHADNPQGICLLDSATPERIPSGAKLMITNASAFGVALYFSSTEPLGISLKLASGNSAFCCWSNGVWQSLQPSRLKPPGNLRIDQQ